MAETFVTGIVKVYGMPQSIISDLDLVFISYFWRKFLKMSSTSLKMSFAYHLQTDSQTEVFNRCIEQYLRCFSYQHPRKSAIWFFWNSTPTDSSLYSKGPIKSLQVNFIDHFQ